MKIEKFLEKIHYKVLSGEMYFGLELKENLLYRVNFSNQKETEYGYFLISSISQEIYYIEYKIKNLSYYYQKKEMEKVEKPINKVSINEIINLISK